MYLIMPSYAEPYKQEIKRIIQQENISQHSHNNISQQADVRMVEILTPTSGFHAYYRVGKKNIVSDWLL